MGPCRSELRETSVAGKPFRWRTTGTGPPLVLVHGLSGSSRWWDSVLPSLAESYECHLLDVPRFGSALRPDETAEWVARWMDAGALEHVRLVGHSVGGAAAARLAALRPELVDALVLVSAVGMPFGRRVEWIRPTANRDATYDGTSLPNPPRARRFPQRAILSPAWRFVCGAGRRA